MGAGGGEWPAGSDQQQRRKDAQSEDGCSTDCLTAVQQQATVCN